MVFLGVMSTNSRSSSEDADQNSNVKVVEEVADEQNTKRRKSIVYYLSLFFTLTFYLYVNDVVVIVFCVGGS